MLVRLLPLAVLLAAGCGPAKLNESLSYDMAPGAAPAGVFLPPQPKPQKITVEFKSGTGDVTVLLFKSTAVTDDTVENAAPDKALGFKKGAEGSFTADVPENTETRLVVRDAAKKTKVDVKVTNK